MMKIITPWVVDDVDDVVSSSTDDEDYDVMDS